MKSKNDKFIPTIGLEVHCELRTKTKLFCGCPADHFGKPPNTQTCPVCLGLPGELPVTNKKAVDWTILLGLALHSKINKEPKFDRKHYFYPDLPMGFQISQYDEPFCIGGFVDTKDGRVDLTRVHLEIDTGKLQHSEIDGEKVSLIDFNRSGVALMEIVTEPVIHSGTQAREFAKNLQQIIRYLGISDCDMEKGSMRLEANISWGLGLGYKVEVKNLNSFRFLEKAINYELDRQKRALEEGEKLIQETRGWNEARGVTFSQRMKETAEDYRYMPDPDLPPMAFTDNDIKEIASKLPELPYAKKERFVREFGIKEEYASIFTEDKTKSDLADKLLKELKSKKIDMNKAVNWIINKKLELSKIKLADLEKEMNANADKITDTHSLEEIAKRVMNENPEMVSQFRKGKTNVSMALVGQMMKTSQGKIDPKLSLEILLKLLS